MYMNKKYRRANLKNTGWIAVFVLVALAAFKIPLYNYTAGSYAGRITVARFFIVVLSIGWLLLNTIYFRKLSLKKHELLLLLLIGLLFAGVCFSSVINRKQLGNCLREMLCFVVFPVYFFCGLRKQSLRELLINTWKWFFLVLNVIDIATVLMYPSGMYNSGVYRNNWFLGYKTQRVIFSYPMVVLWGYTEIKANNKLTMRAIVPFILAAIDAVLTEATGGLLSLLSIPVFYMLMVLAGRKPKLKKVEVLGNVYIMTAAYLLLVFLIITMRATGMIQILTSWVGKDVSFTGRSHIWRQCLRVISKSPIWGCGIMLGADFRLLTGWIGGTNAHNAILTVLINGGAVALALYTGITLMAFRSHSSKTMCFLLAATYGLWILGITSAILAFSEAGLITYVLAVYEKRKER